MDEITKAQQGIADRAKLAAIGIEQMGGASKLTDAQLRVMNKTMQEGLSAFKALGTDAGKDLEKVADEVKTLAKRGEEAGGAFGVAKEFITAFVGAFTIDRLIEFGKTVIHNNAAIDNLSKATGVSADALQRWRFVGTEFDLTMEDIGRGLQQLSDRLASGDKSATSAVQRLGLSVKELIAAGPEEAFLRVAEAAGRIEDPMTKNAVASDLFGAKLGKVLIPALGELREKLAAVPKTAIISDENIQAAADFETKIKRLTITVEAYASKLIGLATPKGLSPFVKSGIDLLIAPVGAPGLDENRGLTSPAQAERGVPPALTNAQLVANELKRLREDALEPLTAAQKKNIDSLIEWGKSEAEIAPLVGATESAVHRYIQAQKDGAAATKQHAQEIKQWQQELFSTFEDIIKVSGGVDKLQDAFDRLQGVEQISVEFAAIAGHVDDLNTKSDEFESTLREIFDLSGKIGAHFSAERTAAANVKILGGLGTSIPQAAIQALQGGGNVAAAVAGTAGAGIASNVVAKFGQTITDKLGKTFGGAINAVLPGLGALAGPLVSFIGKLFGKSEESAKVSPLRDAFFKAAGGLDVLNPKVQALTGNLKAVEDVFKAKTVDDYNAAIQRLNGILGLQDQAMADLNTAVQKYGFSIDELGPKFSQQKLNEQQGVLLKDWKLLNEAVGDHNVLLTKTAGSFQEIVTAALKSGATISSEFEGPIQDLINMGLLTDENGDKLTDLSRIKFGSLDSEFSKLTAAINNLTRALGGAVEEADNLARDREATINVRTNFDTSDVPKSSDFPVFEGAEGFAEGTKGWRNFGSGTPAVLHGIEAVVTPEQVNDLARNASAAASSDALPSINITFTGAVLATTEYVEQNLIDPILTGIERYQRARFGRLVATVTP